jgi:hypothetical protein
MAPPPGYVAYGSAPTPTQKVSRINGLATAITVVVAIAGLGGLLNGFLQSGLRSDAEDLLAGRISDSDFNEQLVSSSAFSALSGVATIAAMVLVMIWMYRISANLRAFGITTTWHPLFAVFGWFLPPVVLYVIPFLMLREQWTKSTPSAAAAHSGSPPDTTSENSLLWVWWVAFGIWPLIALFLSAGSLVGSFGDTGAEAVAESLLDTNQTVTIIGSFVGLVAAVAWILFVRQLTARHRTLTSEN